MKIRLSDDEMFILAQYLSTKVDTYCIVWLFLFYGFILKIELLHSYYLGLILLFDDVPKTWLIPGQWAAHSACLNPAFV